MTKRVKLLKAIRSFTETEMITHIADWDFVKMDTCEKIIQQLDTRIPKVVLPPPTISSQRKIQF